MMRALLILALGACSPTTWKRADRVSFGLAVTAIACDWGQTRSAAAEGWSGGRHEANPMMGPSPDVRTVDQYMGMSLAITSMVWLVLPHKIGPFVMGGVTVAEASTIQGNRATTHGTCGL